MYKRQKFVLLEKDGKTQIGEEKSTNADGEIAFGKLDEGTYYLKETASPTGYTLLAEAIKVEIIAEKDETTKKANGRFTVKVNDQEVNATTGEYSSYIDEEAGTANIAVELSLIHISKVTEKAIQGNAGNENAAVIVYNHKPNATTTSEKETAYVYSLSLIHI